ncbi:MAG: carboxypeptidase regulatory-like domain-containing protein [Roseibacillus sp.]|nr:carboxypeptidase regulatory-like domain-containing protein [Roseibacillus sp.]
MKNHLATMVATLLAIGLPGHANSIDGRVTNAEGKAMEGVMISAFDNDWRKSTSVFSQADGSFHLDGLRDVSLRVRARLLGQRDKWIEDVEPGTKSLAFGMEPARGVDLEVQRPANSGFGMLKFESMRDKLNFKMMCSYCHQIGTVGFRTPEKPVDWETMITRMDGYGGLYRHTRSTIVKRLIETYKDDAVKKWPKFVPPPPPTGDATKVKITAWEMGDRYEGSFHDLELGPEGLVYAVNISKHRLVTLDPKTGERKRYQVPRGSWGPHSVELSNEGDLWITMCASGQMAKFDPKTKEFLVCSSGEAPAKRGSYPHTLRINPKDPEGLIWYTDAGRNSCFSLHPKTLEVKEYHLLKADQAVAAGKGESRGITPYGLDYSPVDGTIWYTKLNGNRIGRIDPSTADGDIKEWNPPFRGPRRLHLDQDGIVWVPGFGSGVFGKFDPKTEEWTVYPLPDAANQIPYALNVDPKGKVWICGTGNDTLYRFDPKTEQLLEFRLPMRVSYTREIEFDAEGNVWTSTSGPARHMETGCGAIIKLEVPDNLTGGVKLVKVELNDDERGLKPPGAKPPASPFGKLLTRIDGNDLPKDYRGGSAHQPYVDRVMASMSGEERGRVGQLWAEKERIDPEMANRGSSFVRILDYVAKGEGRKRPGKKIPGPPTAAKPKASGGSGTRAGLSGVVRFKGPRPKRQLIPMNEQSRDLYETAPLDESVLVSKRGGVANVFVYVKEVLKAQSYPMPANPALVDQEKSMFRPRVQGIRVGQEVLMRNGDPFIHNVRSLSSKNRPFNIAQPAGTPDRLKVFKEQEGPITIKCDFHPWMTAHFFVMDHPFFAVTDEEGNFSIKGLPAGEYTLGAWHEKFGDKELTVTVGPQAKKVGFLFKAEEE